MGSFSFTCAASGLPIEAGDAVRAILITQNPYGDEGHGVTAEYFPRTFPLSAAYDDYGSIEDYADGVAKDLWMEGFQADMVVRGMGDNKSHDIPTSKDMSFEDMLRAVQENRLQVVRDFGMGVDDELIKKLMPKKKTPKGVPTMQRVKKLLVKAGLNLTDTAYDVPGYFVSNKTYGKILVRWSSHENKRENLEKARQAIEKEYPCVITIGDGNYNFSDPNLFVFVHPDTKEYAGKARTPKEKPLQIAMAMIREDVWEALRNTPSEYYGPDYHPIQYTSDKFREESRIVYANAMERLRINDSVNDIADDETRKALQLSHKLMGLGRSVAKTKTLFESYVLREALPYTVSIVHHWNLLCEKRLPMEQVAPILDSIADMIHITRVLADVRWYWRRSSLGGPQFGEWKQHKLFHEKMASLCDAELSIRHVEDVED